MLKLFLQQLKLMMKKEIQNLKNRHEYFIIFQKHFIAFPQFNEMCQGRK